MSIAEAMNIAAPLYNLAMVAVLVGLFIRLFTTKARIPDVFMTPWKLMFAVICVFIVEEVITALRVAGVINITVYINGFFELIIVSLVLYLLLMQRQHLTKSR